MILLTLGTYPLPFDRLVKVIDQMVAKNEISGEVFAQIGVSNYTPKSMQYEKILEKEEFDERVKDASFLISHAGMGSIDLALTYNKPLLVMPRRKKYGEHVNDHQLGTAKKFEKLGHVLVAYTEDEIPEKIKQLKSFVPKPRKAQTKAVVDRINRFLNEL